MGGMMAYASSKKQKCVTKSPTESKLVALTDNLRFVELFQDFAEFVTMKSVQTPIVYHNCNAVVSLVTKGCGIQGQNT